MATEQNKTPPPELEIGEEAADGTVQIVDPAEQAAEQDEDKGAAAAGPDDKGADDATGTDDSDDPDGSHDDDGDPLSDPTQEAKRQRRRQERQDRRLARRDREETLKLELQRANATVADLAGRLSAVERRTGDSEIAQLDVNIQKANQAAEYFKNIIAAATTKQDGATVADATLKLYQAKTEQERLTRIREQYSTMTAPAPQVDPAIRLHAGAWMQRNSWYSPQSGDPDSRIALALDQGLAAEGKDPRDPGYYTELDRRLRRYLPHRFTKQPNRDDNDADPAERQRKPGGSPVAGSGRNERGAGNGASNGAKGSTFTLSAARVQALKDAGMWENPVERAKAIRDYREFDRNAAKQTK